MISNFFYQYKMYFYCAVALSIFYAGWSVNGLRLNSIIDKMKAEHNFKVLETERIAHEVVANAESEALKKIHEARKERDDALQSIKKLRGVTIDGRIVGVLSNYTNNETSPSSGDVKDYTGAIDTTYDAEEQTMVIIENYAKFNECREQVIGWNQFYDYMLKEFNK